MNQAARRRHARRTISPTFSPEPAAIISAGDFDLRGTRENSRLSARESAVSANGSRPYGCTGQISGAQICILSGRTTTHVSGIVSEGEGDPIHKMPLKGFKLARVARQSPSFTLLSLAAIRLVSLHAPFVFYLGP